MRKAKKKIFKKFFVSYVVRHYGFVKRLRSKTNFFSGLFSFSTSNVEVSLTLI